VISCCLGVNSFIICFASTSFAGVFRLPCLKDLLLTHASFERVQDQPQDYQDHHDGSPDVQEVELYIFFHIGRIGFHSSNHRRPRREPAVVELRWKHWNESLSTNVSLGTDRKYLVEQRLLTGIESG